MSSSAAAPTGGTIGGGRRRVPRWFWITIAALVAVALVVGSACVWPGWAKRDSSAAPVPTSSTTPTGTSYQFNDWSEIKSTKGESQDVDSQKALKEVFLGGFVQQSGGNGIDEEKLAAAAARLGIESDNLWQDFESYVLDEKTVIEVEWAVGQAWSEDPDSFPGRVEARKEGDSVLLWHLFQPEEADWSVVYDDSDQYRVLAYGLDRKLSDEDVQSYVLDLAKYRPAVLQAYYFAAFDTWLDINALVVDPAAYASRQPTVVSPEAQAYWRELRDALLAASTERRDLTAEEIASLFNTGSDGLSFHQSSQQGVGGDDILALVWSLPNGRKVYALFRCGNPLLQSNEVVPPGPTDDHPLVSSPTPTPASTPPVQIAPKPTPAPTKSLEKKQASQDTSAQNPGAGEESGVQDDPGPGELRTPPAKPAPVQTTPAPAPTTPAPVQTTPAPVQTTPAPPPPPESSAPPPGDEDEGQAPE